MCYLSIPVPVTAMLELNTLKLWILRAVSEGNETARDVYDYVSGCGYDGSDKAVMMDLKRYAGRGMIHRKRIGGKYHYEPCTNTSQVMEHLELWEGELIESPTQKEMELMFWYQVSLLHLERNHDERNHDTLRFIMSVWFVETDPWKKRSLLLATKSLMMEDAKHCDFDGRYLYKLYRALMRQLAYLPA